MKQHYIVGSKTRSLVCGIIDSVFCPKCGFKQTFGLMENKTSKTLLGIPYGKTIVDTFIECSVCGDRFKVDNKKFNPLSSTTDAEECIYEHCREKHSHITISSSYNNVVDILFFHKCVLFCHRTSSHLNNEIFGCNLKFENELYYLIKSFCNDMIIHHIPIVSTKDEATILSSSKIYSRINGDVICDIDSYFFSFENAQIIEESIGKLLKDIIEMAEKYRLYRKT